MTVREVVVSFIACLVLSLLFVAPWVPNPETAPTVFCESEERAARLDISIWTYLLAWGARHPDRFYDGDILKPLPNALACNDPRMTEGIWTMPLFRSLPPLTAWGISIVIALWATGWASWIAGRWITGSAWGGVALAVLYGFGNFRANHVVHIEGLFNPFLPLAVAALKHWLDDSTRRNGILSFLFSFLAMIEYSYIAVVVGLLFPAVILIEAMRRNRSVVRALAPFAAALILVALCLLPIASVYLEQHRSTGLERGISEVDISSADVYAWLTSPDARVLSPFGWRRFTNFDFNLFPGFVLTAVAMCGAAMLWRRAFSLTMLGLLGFLISFGTCRLLLWRSGYQFWDYPTPYEILYDLLVPLKAIRSPARHSVVVHLTLGFAAAYFIGAYAVTLRRRTFSLLLLALAFGEARANMHEIEIVPRRASDPVYQLLRDTADGAAVLDLPMGNYTSTDRWKIEAGYLFTSLVHRHPTPNGTMAIMVPWHESLSIHLARPRPNETEYVLRACGIGYVVCEDSSSAVGLMRIGLRSVPVQGSELVLLKVDSPMSVPKTPAVLQERLMEMEHSHYVRDSNVLGGTIAPPKSATVSAGHFFEFPVIIENGGTKTWCVNGRIFGVGPRGDLSIGVSRWRMPRDEWPRNMRGGDLSFFGRIPNDVAPGETALVWVRGIAPVKEGSYEMDLDYYAQSDRWINDPDSPPARMTLVVESPGNGPENRHGAAW